MPVSVGCSISIRSLTQFGSEDELKSFISGPLSEVIYADWVNMRKAELEGLEDGIATRDANALLAVTERGGRVSCSIGFDF